MHPHYRMIDRADIAAIRQHGQLVFVWTVNLQQEINHMLNLGVSGVITDYTARMRELLAARA
ncbi:hypothetical protein XYCOK13_30960 [Xylanibacillus composti]|uniref:GP-PDE domain-containing protein n=1 Tax=Xylanibacillus composti TaxID=1572762 RepID=A0A8J4H634_9BACL|nr:hypothetical protein XYCOK13_30960 [Xylanibacillus composti]